jgi:hypothetical protein
MRVADTTLKMSIQLPKLQRASAVASIRREMAHNALAQGGAEAAAHELSGSTAGPPVNRS